MRVNSINDENNTNDKNEVISDEDEEIPESPTFHTDVADMLQVGKITLIKDTPLNSHGFTVCHMVLLPFSQFHVRFFISHGFTNF